MKRILLFTLLKQRWSLRSRIIIGLITYQILLTLGILANDFVVNETAEELVWTSSLNHEMDHQFNRRHTDPDYAWPDTDALAMFAIDPDNKKHAALVDVAPGLYDEFLLEGKSRVILVREIDNQKFALSLNIENLEHNEAQLRNTILIAAASVSLTFCLFIAWAAGWLVRPLRELAQQIQRLTPDQQKQRVQLPENASAELEIIADAMNTYIERNAQFFERERDFINMASHELRTPLSVIDGAAKLSLNETDIPEKTRNRLLRIQDVIRNVNEMINLLLVLAKDPARVHETSEQIFLDKVLQDIIKEHNFLAENKNVQIIIETTQQVEILAPLQMVKCALGNLLRNAIENSHDGTIFINLHADSTITITNTSHAMSMDEISALYTRLARNKGRNGGGIGLDLIRRLCEHCKWTLSFLPESDTITFSVKFQHQ